MKKSLFLMTLLFVCSVATGWMNGQSGFDLDSLIAQFDTAVPQGFTLQESGPDGENVFAVYKKSPQEVITVNLQKEHDIEFSDVEELAIDGRKAVFYHMGFDKNGGMAVFLQNGSGYLVVGYNKPFMGDEAVEPGELEEILNKIDLSRFE